MNIERTKVQVLLCEVNLRKQRLPVTEGLVLCSEPERLLRLSATLNLTVASRRSDNHTSSEPRFQSNRRTR